MTKHSFSEMGYSIINYDKILNFSNYVLILVAKILVRKKNRFLLNTTLKSIFVFSYLNRKRVPRPNFTVFKSDSGRICFAERYFRQHIDDDNKNFKYLIFFNF